MTERERMEREEREQGREKERREKEEIKSRGGKDKKYFLLQGILPHHPSSQFYI